MRRFVIPATKFSETLDEFDARCTSNQMIVTEAKQHLRKISLIADSIVTSIDENTVVSCDDFVDACTEMASLLIGYDDASDIVGLKEHCDNNESFVSLHEVVGHLYGSVMRLEDASDSNLFSARVVETILILIRAVISYE